MSQGSVAVMSNYNLEPSGKYTSWSKFAREISAASILSFIPLGKFLEISDKKFSGESLILFRRTDFDNLNMLSSKASKVSRYLMQIDRITTTLTNSDDPNKVIQLIREEARMGIEYTVVQSTSSASEYFQSAIDSANISYADLPLPVKKKK